MGMHVLIKQKLAYILIYHHKVGGKHKYMYVKNLNFFYTNGFTRIKNCCFKNCSFSILLWQSSQVWSKINMTNDTVATTRILNINMKYVEVVFFFFALRLLVKTFVRPVLSATNTKWYFLRHVTVIIYY